VVAELFFMERQVGRQTQWSLSAAFQKHKKKKKLEVLARYSRTLVKAEIIHVMYECGTTY
jgi:hypothetical protein